MPVKIDLAGRRFGLLVVLRDLGPRNGKTYWQCRCDCGKEHVVAGGHLTGGRIASCGCTKAAACSLRLTRHGLSKTHPKTLQVWIDMLKRCENPKDQSFPNYGARGISVCERWHRVENFVDDMGYAQAGMTLDRINNDGNYEPANCRWVTHQENCSNTRRNVLLEFEGERKTLTQWARSAGIDESTFYSRVRIRGWSMDRALSTPPGG